MTSRSAGDFGRQPGGAGGLPQAEASPWRPLEPAPAAGETSDDWWAAQLTADRRQHGGAPDAVAGSEFVDDRIRLRE